MGQALVLHFLDCLRAAQALPLWRAAMETLRVRGVTPPAQDLEHLAHLRHLPTTQLTGHLRTSHSMVCLREGQRPSLLFMMMERVRDWLPTPQALLQVE